MQHHAQIFNPAVQTAWKGIDADVCVWQPYFMTVQISSNSKTDVHFYAK
jgi:hypothetical protein